MSEPFVGEIRMFAGNFSPRGWAFCDGQLLAVSQNDALFSLLGTIYGGDGRTTFGLPDLRGRIPLHQGNGPGLSNRRIGSRGGGETATITPVQLASHTHDFYASTADATAQTPQGHVLAKTLGGPRPYAVSDQSQVMAADMVGFTGGSLPHVNLMPTLCVNFIIALFGIYPSRH